MNPLRTLIVEDEPLIAMCLEDTLVNAGHTVVGCADTFASALDLAVATAPDLVLVDIHLADGLTGIALASKLSSEFDLNIVFTSGNIAILPDDFAGAMGAIGKPYTDSGVCRALQYLGEIIMTPPPVTSCPPSLALSPVLSDRWLTNQPRH